MGFEWAIPSPVIPRESGEWHRSVTRSVVIPGSDLPFNPGGVIVLDWAVPPVPLWVQIIVLAAIIISIYMDCVLEKNQAPKNVFSFCKEHKIVESDFYTFFGSIDALKQQIWVKFFENYHSIFVYYLLYYKTTVIFRPFLRIFAALFSGYKKKFGLS